MVIIEKYLHPFDTFQGISNSNGHRYFAFEINRDCNRACVYCIVPSLYNKDGELSLSESKGVIDKLRGWHYRAGTILGGEPLARFTTKDGITFYDHTLALVKYATSLGMFMGVSTNGDYFSQKAADDFAKAGLDWFTFSLHDDTEKGLKKVIECGRMASEKGIPSMVHFLVTNRNADGLPAMAAAVAENGLFVNATIVQEKVVSALLELRKYGFVRINRKLLKNSLGWYPNSWKCDPEKDTFLHIGAGGTLDACEEVRTDLTFRDIDSLDDKRWRGYKKELVENCSGCLYRCYYESENPSRLVELPIFASMWTIKFGGAGLIKRWGQTAVVMSKKFRPDIDWSLSLP